MTRSSSPRYDAVIIGARVAGAATAMLLARRGARVLLVDRGQPGTDTLSTHALMRGAVVQLARWGVLPGVVAAGTPPIRVTTFDYGGELVPVAIGDRHGVDALYAPRRTVLDRVLVEAAAAAGATVEYGMRLIDLAREDTGRIGGVVLDDGGPRPRPVAADLVVGADGRHSTVARLTGAATRRVGTAMTATVYGHWPGVAAEGYRWMYVEGTSAGAIPTNDGLACVFVTVPAARFGAAFRGNIGAGFRRELARVDPALADAVTAASPEDGLHGFGGQRGAFVQCHGPGWALVGDAAYFKDPLTAHGMTDALLHAELLADAITAGTEPALAAYETTRTAIALPVFEATETIASFDWTLDAVRPRHTALAKAMAAEIEASLAAFRHPAADLGVPIPGDDELRTAPRLGGRREHEQELSAVR